MSKVELVTLKMNLLGGMYELMKEDDLAYDEWISLFPDEPTEDDLRGIAEDEHAWVLACTCFGKIVKHFKLGA